MEVPRGCGAPVLRAQSRFSPCGISFFITMIPACGDAGWMEIAMSPRKHPLAAMCLSAAVLNLAPLPALAQGQDSEVQELTPVVVTATRQEMRANEVLADVTVIERKEIERAGQGTIIDLLSRQPGVHIMQQGGPGTATSIYLRGANYNQTKVLVDGVELNTLDGSASLLRFVPLTDVERIEILRGPASSLYGANTIGGVIQVITRRGQQGLQGQVFIGYGSHDTKRANAFISGGNERWRFRVEGNHHQTDGISSRKDGINKDADKDAYRNDGGAVSASFLPVTGHEIGLSYRNNRGVAHYDGGPQYDPANPFKVTPSDGNYDYREHFEIEQWRLFSRNRILKQWESEISYGEVEDTRKDYNTWNVPTGGVTRTRTKNRQWAWQNNIDLPLGRALFVIERLKQTTGPSIDPAAWNPSLYDHTPEFHNISALAGWTASIKDHRWQVNVRHDRHSEFGSKATFGMSYGYQLSEALRAHVAYGTAFRAPSIVDLYRPDWGGNPNLKPEEAKNAEAGLTWEKGAHLASVIYYHNRIKDLIVWQPTPLPFGQNENVGKALLEGVTLNWQGTFGAWRLNAGHDWLNAQNKSHDAVHKQLARRARNKATASLTHTWDKLETALEAVAVGKRYDASNNRETLGGYTLVNLAASYALTPELHLEGRLNNLFDKKYETARYYNTEGFSAFLGLRYLPRR
jgi:vitamin B12 transporter